MAYRNHEDQLACQRRGYRRHRKQRIKKNCKRIVALRAKITKFKMGLLCFHCGFSFKKHPYCCDFHNPDESRDHTRISNMIRDGHASERIFYEILQCIPLCSNCHRIAHHS